MVGLPPYHHQILLDFFHPPPPTCVTPIDDTGRMGRGGVGPPFSRQLGGTLQR